jgi:hypothetical protein
MPDIELDCKRNEMNLQYDKRGLNALRSVPPHCDGAYLVGIFFSLSHQLHCMEISDLGFVAIWKN